MDRSLSDNDINNFLNSISCYRSIILYGDIKKGQMMKSIKDWINGDRYPIVINYLTKENYGHWVCLFQNEEGINFFDSYGNAPDDHLAWNIGKKFRKESGEDNAYLCQFILDIMGHDKFVYNDYDFQKRSPNVSTCGRWVLFRLMYRNLSCDEFKKMILEACNRLKLSKDQLAVELTDGILY